ncbi:MAG: hypothetical protein ACRD1V_07840 [Vicinamibacterales bacterium]
MPHWRSYRDRRARPRGAASGEPCRSELVDRILAHYREMPGLALRLGDAAGLLGVGQHICEIVLADLVREGRLRIGTGGSYLG